jgi:hypothetical protein
MLQVGRSRDPVSMRCIFFNFFSLPDNSSRTMALGSTQPLTEMNTRNSPGEGGGGGKRRPALRANIFTAIYEPII